MYAFIGLITISGMFLGFQGRWWDGWIWTALAVLSDTVMPARIRVRRYGCVLARRGRFDSRLEAAVEYAFAP